MLRIGLCDDEADARDSLRFALEKIIDEEKEQIVYEFSSGKTAVHWLKEHPGEIDLLFLDIEMDGLDGLETAKEIRAFNQDILLVFLTGYPDYVYDGYGVNALDYLLKPIDMKKLLEVIKRVREKMETMQETYLSFHNADGTYRIRQNDILYLYSNKRLVVLVTDDTEISFYDKLDRLESVLDSYFVRIHQRYLVNGKKVTFIGNSTISIKETNLPVSRSQKLTATNTLAKILLEGSDAS